MQLFFKLDQIKYTDNKNNYSVAYAKNCQLIMG
ncbi:MAG: hypothetical protein PWR19_2228 [Carnobacterium sp.]|nr:hypothetical protein [Carnobacterium sp.]